MVDKKISDLDQAQPISPDDILVIVQNINNTLQTHQITVGELFSSCVASRVLVINDSNVSQYFVHVGVINSHINDVYFYLPDGYSIIVVETTNRYKIVKIMPVAGGVDFADYKKIMFMGNVDFWEGDASNSNNVHSGDYRISRYWYSQRHGGSNYVIEAFTEFILKDKVWYSVFY